MAIIRDQGIEHVQLRTADKRNSGGSSSRRQTLQVQPTAMNHGLIHIATRLGLPLGYDAFNSGERRHKEEMFKRVVSVSGINRHLISRFPLALNDEHSIGSTRLSGPRRKLAKTLTRIQNLKSTMQ
jgi:hypothetical protein